VAEPALNSIAAAAPGAATASVALVVVDDECVVAEASLAACRLLGVSREEIVGHPLADWLEPVAAERFGGVWSAFHETGGHAGPFELGAPTLDPVDVNVTPAVLPGRHLVLLAPSDRRAGANDAAPVPGHRNRSGGGPTARERQILSMLAAGDTDAQVASKLDLSPATVQTHVRNAKAKLGARTRAQAVAMAITGGLIAEPTGDHELVA
jgi:DNA-binding CsgD family transcriptional regulator